MHQSEHLEILQLKKNEDKIDKIFLLIKILLLLINFIKTNTLLSIYILKEEIYSQPIHYLLKIMDNCLSLGLSFVEIKENANFIFDHTDKNSVQINIEFFRSLIIEKNYNYNHYFRQKPIIYFKDGQKEDWLSSAFYIINCFQEYQKEENCLENDIYGRFKYESSFQYRFNCIEENLVQQYFILFCRRDLNLQIKETNFLKSRVFLSHDIDSVNGSFLQDGLWAIKKGRLDIVVKLIFNEIFSNPDWKNIDFINRIHNEYNLKSTFFWLASNKIGKNQIKNGDYNFSELSRLSSLTKSNGLHKSSLEMDIDEEIKTLPFKTNFNRYHFLKFGIPEDWHNISNSSVLLDASLGFAERIGFRNGFGLPFKPYNLMSESSYDFIEVPLNIMDGTLQKYMNIPMENTSENVINFFEKNKTNTLISILWHNTFFTNYKYKGYLNEYKKILNYILESKVVSVTPEDLIEEFK